MMSLIATCLFMLLMCLGLPIAASLGLAAGAVIWWYDMPLTVIAQRTVNSLDSTPLLAVPMFIFAACIFNTAGITQQLFDWIRMMASSRIGSPPTDATPAATTSGSRPPSRATAPGTVPASTWRTRNRSSSDAISVEPYSPALPKVARPFGR